VAALDRPTAIERDAANRWIIAADSHATHGSTEMTYCDRQPGGGLTAVDQI